MKRLTVEDIQNAYEKSGLKPIKGVWLRVEEDKPCGCALSAMICSKSDAKMAEFMSFVTEHEFWELLRDKVVKEINLDPEYVYGFVNGYDRSLFGKREKNTEIYNMAYGDGYAASKAMFPDWDKIPTGWTEEEAQ